MTGRPDPGRLVIALCAILALVGIMVVMASMANGRKAAPNKRDRPSNPLSVELRRCGDLGERARADVRCRAAWDESRARFFGEQDS